MQTTNLNRDIISLRVTVGGAQGNTSAELQVVRRQLAADFELRAIPAKRKGGFFLAAVDRSSRAVLCLFRTQRTSRQLALAFKPVTNVQSLK